MRYVPLALLFLFLPVHALEGATVDLSHVNLDPFLRIVETRFITSIQAPGTELTIDQDIFVSKGGGATFLQVSFSNRFGYETVVTRAICPKAVLDALSQALTLNRVGFQANCELRGGPIGRRDVYWYGKGGRKNVFSFKISSPDSPPDPSFPPCSAVGAALFGAVTNFVSDLVGLPDAQTIIYPPPRIE